MSAVSLFLGKLLAVALSPIGVATGLCLLALIPRRRGPARALLTLAVLVLWIASMPAFANWVASTLEAQYPPRPVAAMPTADVIIVLGGIAGQPLPPRVSPDLGEPADRLLDAARLYRAGKAGTILVAGGNVPWQAAVRPEAEILADLLVEIGVPRDAIMVENASRNTHENAANAGALMKAHGWRTALVVTSAFHMPRAMAVFRRAGIEATPAAADVRVRYPLYDSGLDFLPDASALERSSNAIREWIGLLAYRLRGWA